MSHYMTALAMRQTGLKPAAKIVLYWLADHHNSETGLCCPGIDTLAAEAEMDRTTVIRHIKSLEDAGLISRCKRFKATGERNSDSYRLFLEKPTKSQNATDTKSHFARDQVAKCDRNLGRVTLEDNTHPNGCDTGKPVSPVKEAYLILEKAGLSNRHARSMVGRWNKEHGRNQVVSIILSARDKPDPVAYVTAALKPKLSLLQQVMAERNERIEKNAGQERPGGNGWVDLYNVDAAGTARKQGRDGA